MTTSSSLRIVAVPAFQDNYLWVMRQGTNAVLVDPGDAKPVLDYLETEKLTLVAILVTHHHADHIGGLPEILDRFKVPVYGPRDERIAAITHRVGEKDQVSLPEINAKFEVIEVPGHTRAHIAYYGEHSLFCGDTLFACGCGRMFEGTPPQMWGSLKKLAALPGNTKFYCAHEYTMANIAFAKAVEPANQALAQRALRDAALREKNIPTVPATIGEEIATNPFFRCEEPEVIAAASTRLGRAPVDAAETFGAIREWKNKF
ncbi:MAG: hydroxyacylglutathione hydrolase [Burkholderiales bacterium]